MNTEDQSLRLLETTHLTEAWILPWMSGTQIGAKVIFAPMFDFRVLVLESPAEGHGETLRTLEYRHVLPPPQRDCYLTDTGRTFDHNWCPYYFANAVVGNSVYFSPCAIVFPPEDLGSVLVMDTSSEEFRALDPKGRLRPPNRIPAVTMER